MNNSLDRLKLYKYFYEKRKVKKSTYIITQVGNKLEPWVLTLVRPDEIIKMKSKSHRGNRKKNFFIKRKKC